MTTRLPYLPHVLLIAASFVLVPVLCVLRPVIVAEFGTSFHSAFVAVVFVCLCSPLLLKAVKVAQVERSVE